MRSTGLLVCVVAFLAPSPATSEWRYGFGGLYGDPRGELGRQIGKGGGVYGHALYEAAGPLGIRIDGSFFLYGTETVRSSIPGTPRLMREVETDNWIGDLTVGPQLMPRSGRVRPYVQAFAGIAYYSTSSTLVDPNRFGTRSSTNYDDAAAAYGGGAGALIELKRGGPCLDVGARFVHAGRASFLREGDLHDDGHGGVTFTPRSSAGDRIEARLGLVFGR